MMLSVMSDHGHPSCGKYPPGVYALQSDYAEYMPTQHMINTSINDNRLYQQRHELQAPVMYASTDNSPALFPASPPLTSLPYAGVAPMVVSTSARTPPATPLSTMMHTSPATIPLPVNSPTVVWAVTPTPVRRSATPVVGAVQSESGTIKLPLARAPPSYAPPKPHRTRRASSELTRSFHCSEPSCDRRYEAWRSLQHHLRVKHGIIRKRYDDDRGLDQHVERAPSAGGRHRDNTSASTSTTPTPTSNQNATVENTRQQQQQQQQHGILPRVKNESPATTPATTPLAPTFGIAPQPTFAHTPVALSTTHVTSTSTNGMLGHDMGSVLSDNSNMSVQVAPMPLPVPVNVYYRADQGPPAAAETATNAYLQNFLRNLDHAFNGGQFFP